MAVQAAVHLTFASSPFQIGPALASVAKALQELAKRAELQTISEPRSSKDFFDVVDMIFLG